MEVSKGILIVCFSFGSLDVGCLAGSEILISSGQEEDGIKWNLFLKSKSRECFVENFLVETISKSRSRISTKCDDVCKKAFWLNSGSDLSFVRLGYLPET